MDNISFTSGPYREVSSKYKSRFEDLVARMAIFITFIAAVYVCCCLSRRCLGSVVVSTRSTLIKLSSPLPSCPRFRLADPMCVRSDFMTRTKFSGSKHSTV